MKITNLTNAARLLDWLDKGAPHTAFSLDWAVATPDEVLGEGATVGDDERKGDPEEQHVSVGVDNPACGTVACIAGAAYLMEKGLFGTNDATPVAWAAVKRVALEFLGVPENDAAWLQTMPRVFDPDAARDAMERSANAADAAQALRNTIKYGEPRWEDIA